MTDPITPGSTAPGNGAPDPVRAFVLADRALVRVVRAVRDDQWDLVLPPGFARAGAPTDPVTLRQVLAYHAYDEAWVPDMLAGRTMDEVGRDRFDGDLLAADPRAAFAALVDLGVAAAETVRDLHRVVHYSYGDFPLAEALWHVTSFRGLRAVDLARVLGQDDTLDPELVALLWEAFVPQAELWRSMGVFGPAVEVPADAPLQERLLGLTGRRPVADRRQVGDRREGDRRDRRVRTAGAAPAASAGSRRAPAPGRARR